MIPIDENCVTVNLDTDDAFYLDEDGFYELLPLEYHHLIPPSPHPPQVVFWENASVPVVTSDLQSAKFVIKNVISFEYFDTGEDFHEIVFTLSNEELANIADTFQGRIMDNMLNVIDFSG
jgi:hypothetical protein